MRISDWSSDVCSSDLLTKAGPVSGHAPGRLLPALRSDGVLAGQCGEQDPRPLRGAEPGRPVVRQAGSRSAAVGALWAVARHPARIRSEEHTSELQSLMRISYAVFCLKKKNQQKINNQKINT